MRVLAPLGTRPEIIKMSPVIAALKAAGFAVRTVATGQHYDANLTDAFFSELGLNIDERWELPADEAGRVGQILASAMNELAANPADLVLVLGDTYTVPLFCLAARRHGTPVAHLEAGLRSFNPTSMEEVNRKIAAATCSLNLAPTEMAARFLESEGIDRRRIRVVGNPVIDVVRASGVKKQPPRFRKGTVVTAHRSTNVDDPSRLRSLVGIIKTLAERAGPVSFPVHPRTAARLEESGLIEELKLPGIDLMDPVDYHSMLEMISAAGLVVTDSGGLQEEAAWLGVPVIVLRRSTPRWESVEAGLSVLAGLDVERVLDAAKRFGAPDEQQRVAASPCPYGDGRTGPRVAELLLESQVDGLLRLEEPDFLDAPVAGLSRRPIASVVGI